MTPHRVHVKYFVKEPDAVVLPALIPVFHRWIQERRVDELLIDVADYKHVHEGPGIMLIGHEADYALDLGRDRPGLLYSRKRLLGGDLRAVLRAAIRQALYACHLLETDASLDLTFRTDEVEVAFLDRLQVPNRASSLASVRSDLEAALASFYSEAAVRVDWIDEDPRRPFAVGVRVAEAADLPTLLAQLHPEPV